MTTTLVYLVRGIEMTIQTTPSGRQTALFLHVQQNGHAVQSGWHLMIDDEYPIPRLAEAVAAFNAVLRGEGKK